MFENPGKKLKLIAKCTAYFLFLASIVGGVVLFCLGFDEMDDLWFLMLLAPVAVLLGFVFAWFSVIVMYGFGELVERSGSIDKKLDTLDQPISNKSCTKQEVKNDKLEEEDKTKRIAEEKAKRVVEENAKRIAEERSKRIAEEVAKAESKILAEKKAAAATAQQASSKGKTLADKLEYALRYQTDEGMINYLKQIDDALVADILQKPAHMIRTHVEEALTNL